MSSNKLSRLCVVLLTVSISAWTVGCGSPASNAPAKPKKDAPVETTPGEKDADKKAPAEKDPAPAEATPAEAEAGSTTGNTGAEVPEGAGDSKKEKAGS